MKIMFFAHDPGGANAIKPLIEPLKKKHKLFIYGKGAALKILPEVIEYNGDTGKLLEKIKPDFVVTGTSAADMTEKELRKSSRKLGIKCLSILDHWVNYNRFTKYTCSQLQQNKKYDELEYLPNYVIVMDDYAKSEMIKVKVPEDIIYPLGNPHFDYIKEVFDKLNVTNLRKNLLDGKKHLIIWASEPYIEDYGQGMELECLKDVIEIMPKDVQLIIKPHPKEKEGKFDNFKDVKIARDITSQEAIKSADLVLSMTSMVLIECIIAGRACLSYQKNEIDKEKFILTKLDALPFIHDKISLMQKVNDALNGSKNYKQEFKINFNATENIIKFIEEKSWKN